MNNYDIEVELEKVKGLNKSFLFLYPILQLKCKKPIQTFLGFENFEDSKSLVCLLHKGNDDYLETLAVMKKHKSYDFHIDDEDYTYVSFYLESLSKLYDQVKNGEYSKISGNARLLLTFENCGLINFGLNPSVYYQDFANFYQYDEDSFRQNSSELVSKPEPQSEYVCLSNAVKKELESMLIL